MYHLKIFSWNQSYSKLFTTKEIVFTEIFQKVVIQNFCKIHSVIRLPRSVLLVIMSLFSVKMMTKTYLRRFTGTTLCAVVKLDVTSTTLKRINAKSGKWTSNSKVSSHIGFRAFRDDILVLNLQQSRGIPRTWKKRLLKNLRNAHAA